MTRTSLWAGLRFVTDHQTNQNVFLCLSPPCLLLLCLLAPPSTKVNTSIYLFPLFLGFVARISKVSSLDKGWQRHIGKVDMDSRDLTCGGVSWCCCFSVKYLPVKLLVVLKLTVNASGPGNSVLPGPGSLSPQERVQKVANTPAANCCPVTMVTSHTTSVPVCGGLFDEAGCCWQGHVKEETRRGAFRIAERFLIFFWSGFLNLKRVSERSVLALKCSASLSAQDFWGVCVRTFVESEDILAGPHSLTDV